MKNKSKKEKGGYRLGKAVSALMERISEVSNIQTKSNNLIERGIRLNVHPGVELKVTLNTDSQTEKIIAQLQEFVIENIGVSVLERFLPELSEQEISARAERMLLGPIKQFNPQNSFGGVWNEWTAKNAAARLGIPQKKLIKIIQQRGAVGNKLRDEQARVSAEATRMFRRSVENGLLSEASFLVRTESWFHQSIVQLREKLAEKNELSKSDKEEILIDTHRALLQVLAFSEGQELEIKTLLSSLFKGRLGEPINLVNLQCMTFFNSEIDGICVVPSARDLSIVTTSGSKLVISQKDALDEVCRFAQILEANNIAAKLTIIIFDNDKIVLPGQDGEIELFLKDFSSLVNEHPVSAHDIEIIRGSAVVDTSSLQAEWERRNRAGDKLTERLVDTEFDRLQDKTLPEAQKSRTFAREVARKGFLLQASLGASLPLDFTNLIVMQRTKAQQQASEILKLGSKLQGVEPPVVIGHWKNRAIVK